MWYTGDLFFFLKYSVPYSLIHLHHRNIIVSFFLFKRSSRNWKCHVTEFSLLLLLDGVLWPLSAPNLVLVGLSSVYADIPFVSECFEIANPNHTLLNREFLAEACGFGDIPIILLWFFVKSRSNNISFFFLPVLGGLHRRSEWHTFRSKEECRKSSVEWPVRIVASSCLKTNFMYVQGIIRIFSNRESKSSFLSRVAVAFDFRHGISSGKNAKDT